MTNELKAWTVIAELKMQAMLAENRIREDQGVPLAYADEPFFAVAKELQSKLEGVPNVAKDILDYNEMMLDPRS